MAIGVTGSTAGIPDIYRVSNPRQPDTNNYLASNYFKFEFTRLPTVTYFCQRVNLPSISFTRAEQGTSFGVVGKVPGGRYDFEDLTVSFIVDEDMKNWIEIYEWMRSIGNLDDMTKHVTPHHDKYSDARITVLNSAYKEKKVIKIRQAFPVSLSGIDFDVTLPETEPVIASASFAFTYYEIENF